MSLDRAREVLELEANAVRALLDRLDDHFVQAVDLLLECSGRVVVTGMGKCGIIARKVAGTLASTGTPAFTLHPAEAIHGDAGMLLPQDVILALSNSGETEEILRILPIIKRIGCTLIAMVGNTHSTLARNADCILDVGVEREACSLGLAPTASTTAALAMGDALAMAVMDKRGFTREDYGLNHPGGSLGKAIVTIREVMRTGEKCPMVSPQDTVQTAIKLVTAAKAGAVLIVDEETRLVGIYTDGDLRRTVVQRPAALTGPISAVMTTSPTVIHPETLAAEGVRIAKKLHIDDLPVVDHEGRAVGLFTVKDLMAW